MYPGRHVTGILCVNKCLRAQLSVAIKMKLKSVGCDVYALEFHSSKISKEYSDVMFQCEINQMD